MTSDGTNFYHSADLGDNWAAGIALPTGGGSLLGLGTQPIIAAPSPGVFIAAANTTAEVAGVRYGQVMISDDGGATWADRTGNLYDIGANGTTQGLQCMQIEYFYE